jgi:GABA(A) receptor-associated protein
MTSIDDKIREFISYPSDKRKKLSEELRKKYPDKIPVLVGRATKNSPVILRHKFLVPQNMSFGISTIEIRKQLVGINEKDAIFFFLGGNIIPPTNFIISSLYDKYKDKDGFLYITYSSENVFG